MSTQAVLQLHAQASGHASAGRLAEARAALDQALQLDPANIRTLHLLASLAEHQGDLPAASAWLDRAIAVDGDVFMLHAYASAIHRARGGALEAIEHGKRAVALNPQAAEAHNDLGLAYLDAGDNAAAIPCFERAIALNTELAAPRNNLGAALQEQGRVEQALAAVQSAIARAPNFASAYNNLGISLAALGRLEEATAAFETCLQHDPRMTQVYLGLVDSYKITSNDDKNLKAIEAHLARGDALRDDERTYLHFAAGKALDDLERYDEAFLHLLAANALKRKKLPYNEAAKLAFFERLRAVVTPELIAERSGSGFAGANPIFIVGMPRSGTTLLEQVLSGHPDVTGAGELHDLPELGGARPRKDGTGVPYPDYLPLIPRTLLAGLGEEYVRRTSQRAPAGQRIIDKMPGNFAYVGLIHLILPNAKIIHLSRNPIDTCVSCFSKHFNAGQEHTYDLAELGRFYRGYRSVMDHWRAVLPAGAFLDVRYEDMVEDLEGQARRILQYCGLEWTPDVLAFQDNARPVMTASWAQVRKPIYNSSIERWRKYERHLGPLLRELPA